MKACFSYYAEGFSDVLERAILENFFWVLPPDLQVSLKEVDTLVCEKYFSIDDLKLKGSWFIEAN